MDRFLGSGIGDFGAGESLFRFSTFKLTVLDDLIEHMFLIKFITKQLQTHPIIIITCHQIMIIHLRIISQK